MSSAKNPMAGSEIDSTRRRIAELEAELQDARNTLDAIRNGEVDAVVVQGHSGPKVYTLESADRPYRLLIEQMQEGALTLSGDGTILYCNRRLATTLRTTQEHLLGGLFHKFVSDADRSTFQWLLSASGTEAGRGEFLLQAVDGTTVPVFLSFSQMPGEGTKVLCGVVTDLTQQKERTRELAATNSRLRAEIAERERAEAELHQAQKMEAVGQLTGGLAHDFNNLLTVISGNLELIQAHTRGDETLTRRVRLAMGAAERGAKLTQQLLAFSRRQTLQPTAICVNDLLPGLEMLVRRAIGADIEFSVVSGDGLWWCNADTNQLESAILNLAINARDAMPDGGRLIISCSNVTLCEAEAQAIAGAAPGRYVRVSVSDTGSGIPPEIILRVFEPFFTTKGIGEGSGLGLSQVYGFVRQSDGFVTIQSAVGDGTVVHLNLPFAEAPQSRPACATPATAPAPGTAPCTVLVVEDDPFVLELAMQMLRSLGHSVCSARTGSEALTLIRQDAGIDLVFSDIVMPGGMSGIDLARNVRRQRADVAVLLTSGYTAQTVARDTDLGEELQIVQKPYRIEDLAQAVGAVLEKRRSRAPATDSRTAVRILLVEDESLVAMMAEEILREFGYEVVGPISKLDVALEIAAQENLDAALLDVNLAGQPVYPLADALMRRGVPVAFVTGYGAAMHPENYRLQLNLQKPYKASDLRRTVRALLA